MVSSFIQNFLIYCKRDKSFMLVECLLVQFQRLSGLFQRPSTLMLKVYILIMNGLQFNHKKASSLLLHALGVASGGFPVPAQRLSSGIVKGLWFNSKSSRVEFYRLSSSNLKVSSLNISLIQKIPTLILQTSYLNSNGFPV